MHNVTAQTNLSRLLQQLLDASILERGLPFGESVRSTKRTQYRIQDPALRFWFRVYSPHRSRWHDYSISQKQKLLQDHASTAFEDFCGQQFVDAARYWEANLEFDLVRRVQNSDASDGLIVSEVKWKRLTAEERQGISKQLQDRWQRCALRHRHPNVVFEVLDSSILKRGRSEAGSRRRSSPAKARKPG